MVRRLFDWWRPQGEEERSKHVWFIGWVIIFVVGGELINGKIGDVPLLLGFAAVLYVLFWPVARWLYVGTRKGRDPDDG